MKFKPFSYLDVSLKESVYINSVPYFTRLAIGEWLGYDNPQKAIDNIISRNPHIDNSEWSTTLNLRVVEGDRLVTRPVRVYDPIGLQLIVFESRQPKAIQYKIAVAKLVADMASGRFFINSTLDLINSIEPFNPKKSMLDVAPRKPFSLWPEGGKLENPSNFTRAFKV